MTIREQTAPDWQARLHAAGLRSVADLLEKSPEELALAGQWCALTKPGLGGRQRWRWERPAAGDAGGVLFVKRYGQTPARGQWDRIVRQTRLHSRGWWEFRQSQRLSEAYIPVPRAVGVAESMRGPFEDRSVVLLEAAPGDGFDRVWAQACRQQAPVTHGRRRHDTTVRLGRFVSAFHQSGFCHRDLYLCHVFVVLDRAGTRPPVFTLIDLARTIRPRLRRMRWVVKDLAQLDSSARQIGATRADRLRWLRAYLGLECGAPRLRWYVRRVVRKSDWILRRIARKNGGA